MTPAMNKDSCWHTGPSTMFVEHDRVACACSRDHVLRDCHAPPASSQSRTGTVSIKPRAASSSVSGTIAAAA